MNPFLMLRTSKAINNACNILMRDEYANAKNKEFKDATALAVKKRLEEKYIVDQLGTIVVTEMGFVTMALLSGHAIYKNDFLLIPGIDDANQFGYLVLRTGFAPYHSLEQSVDDAATDAELAHQKSDSLVSYYGNKIALRHTAQAAPWYLLSKLNDEREAGLCQWGVDSFLKRTHLGFLANRIGLPRFLLRFAGAFGDRVTAATIRRMASHGDVRSKAAHRVNPVGPLY